MKKIDELIQRARLLSPERLGVLLQVAEAVGQGIRVDHDSTSDIVTDGFLEDFSARLLAYHAMHAQKLTKKPFEYLFVEASRAAGRKATLSASAVNPGADAVVDGVPFSLKTEGAQAMKKTAITISKLMEARWIRECRTGEDFARETRLHLESHLSQYERVLVFRAFEDSRHFKYELIEIPIHLFTLATSLAPTAFSTRTKNGSSSAQVFSGGRPAYTLRLDGSVEKVTVSGLDTSLCVEHARWTVNKRSS